jgi:ankyrin repeat protein
MGNYNSSDANKLFEYCQEGSLESVKEIIKKNKKIINEQSYRTGYTPLAYAIEFKHMDVANFLLDSGANPNIKSYITHTSCALVFAVLKRNKYIIKKLFKHGADPNLQDKCGSSALFYAVTIADKKIIMLLLKNGANINLKDKDGCSVLFEASIRKQTSIFKFLLKNGAKTTLKETSLYYKNILSIKILLVPMFSKKFKSVPKDIVREMRAFI